MLKLNFIVLSAKLQKLTQLRPKLPKAIRSISVFDMTERYIESQSLLPKLQSDKIGLLF